MKNKNQAVGGTRFNNATSKIFEKIGTSNDIDKRLYEEDILGSIASDNEHFVYVHIGGMGHAEGRILGSNRLETCYVNPGDNAVVGCSVSTRD